MAPSRTSQLVWLVQIQIKYEGINGMHSRAPETPQKLQTPKRSSAGGVDGRKLDESLPIAREHDPFPLADCRIDCQE